MIKVTGSHRMTSLMNAETKVCIWFMPRYSLLFLSKPQEQQKGNHHRSVTPMTSTHVIQFIRIEIAIKEDASWFIQRSMFLRSGK